MDMNIDPANIHLTPKLKLAIAHYAALEGKHWEELLEDRFPLLEDPTSEELAASLAMCDESMGDLAKGQGVDAKEAFSQIVSRLGLKTEQ